MTNKVERTYNYFSIVLIINGLNIFFKNYLNINLIQINSISIIFLGIYIIFNFYKYCNKSQKLLFHLNLLFFTFLTFLGIFNNNFFSFLLLDLTYFSCFSYSLIFASKYYTTEKSHLILLKKSLFNSLLFLFPFSIVLLYQIGLSPVKYLEDRLNPDLDIDPYSAISLISPSLILILIDFKNNTSIKKILILLSFLLILLFAFFTLSRGLILGLSFIIFFAFKDIFQKFNLKKFIQLTLFSFGIILFLYFIYDFNTLIDNYILLIQRFFNNEDFSNGRDEESDMFLESLNYLEFIFGRGFGGSNKSWIFSNILNGSPIMHKWYFHLILKGGIFFMLFFIIYLSIILFKSLNNFSYYSRYLFYFLILSIGYTPFYSFLSISLFWISVGFFLRNKSNYFNKIKLL